MPVLTQLNLNIGTEQNPNMVLHDLHDIRISSTDVTTVTRLLGCDAGVNSIAPLTLANAASLLGAIDYHMKWLGSINDLNTVEDSGYGYCTASEDNGLFISLVFHSNNNYNKKYRFILKTNDNGSSLKYKVMNDGTWGTWHELQKI